MLCLTFFSIKSPITLLTSEKNIHSKTAIQNSLLRNTCTSLQTEIILSFPDN